MHYEDLDIWMLLACGQLDCIKLRRFAMGSSILGSSFVCFKVCLSGKLSYQGLRALRRVLCRFIFLCRFFAPGGLLLLRRGKFDLTLLPFRPEFGTNLQNSNKITSGGLPGLLS